MMQRRKKEESSILPARGQGILVAVGGNQVDGRVIQIACNLVRNTKRPLYAVRVIEMPWTEAVDDAPEEDRTLQADRMLYEASRAAAASGYHIEPELLQARSAGAAIVDEASARDCGLIVLGLPYRHKYGDYYIGRTIEYVLGHAKAEVWVVREALSDSPGQPEGR